MICRVCSSAECSELIDFGPQPVCHHFVDTAHAEKSHPLALGLCRACGLVQALDPIPPEQLVPHFDWITYNEPEAHLDALVAGLRRLSGIGPQSRLGGISYKEDSTLRRFREAGFPNSWRVDPAADLGLPARQAGMEGIQQRINEHTARNLVQKYGPSDLVVARHVLEHTHDTLGFVRALVQLVKPGGYLVFEVPDCARGFDLLDYTTLWEDHTLYFVEATLLGSLQRAGLKIVGFERYRAPYENCLIAITQAATEATVEPLPRPVLETEIARAEGFASGLQTRRAAVRRLLAEYRREGPIALLGAGHLAATYLNMMAVADLIDFVVDDDSHKSGMQMPGCRLPIVPSRALCDRGVKVCLTSVSAESEAKVIQRNQAFLQAGGMFLSIFPVQKGAVFNPLSGLVPAAV